MDLIKNYLNQIDLDQNEQSDTDATVKNLVDELLCVVVEREHEKIKRKIPKRKGKNEDEIVISSDEEVSSSELEEDNEVNSDLDSNDEDLDKCLIRFQPLKTKGELLLEELPVPAEENIQLTINIDELQQIGNVGKILDNLVIVESFKNLPALDLDSVLFFRTGASVGRVFDVIGPVCKPFYVIRFASNESIRSKSIFINMPIYFVPNFNLNDLNVTKYVLVSQLKSVKGSDASWEHNNEPPENMKEYSDDEEERMAQQKLKAKRKQRTDNNRNDGHRNRGFRNQHHFRNRQHNNQSRRN